MFQVKRNILIISLLLTNIHSSTCKCNERRVTNKFIMSCNSVLDLSAEKNYKELLTLIIYNYKSMFTLEDDSFIQMKNLQRLYITGNINRISSYAFRGLEKLSQLSIRNGKFQELSSQLFNKTPVYHLVIAYSDLKKLPDGIFDTMFNLKILGLMTNKLTTIPLGIFNNLNVEEIDLSENLITKIEEGAFFGSDNLMCLNLRSNKLTEFEPLKVLGKPGIRLLNLDNNAIVEKEIFVPSIKSMHITVISPSIIN